jgi:F-type H+-transporting ATPase subunit b
MQEIQQILQQIGGLLVGAAPTALLFIVLILAYQFLIQSPLTAALKKRRAITLGAMEGAREAILKAESRTAEYATALRQARNQAYKLREERIKQWNQERDTVLESARKTAGDKVNQATAQMEAEAVTARQVIQASAGELASQAVRAILPAAAGGSR